MRRSFALAVVTVGCCAATGALGAGAGAAPASSAGLLRLVVCPLAAGATTPCCGPPILATPSVASYCCPPNAICATPRATIAASPEPSRAGAPVTISGSIVGASGLAVKLWQELPGQSGFRALASTTTSATGAYSFTRAAGAVTTNRSWYVTSVGARSATIQHRVEARVRLAAAVARPLVGAAVGLGGQVDPSHAGERVLLEQQAQTGWKVIARPRLGRSSRFRLRHRFRLTGRVRLRLALPADARNVTSRSAVLTLTVVRGA